MLFLGFCGFEEGVGGAPPSTLNIATYMLHSCGLMSIFYCVFCLVLCLVVVSVVVPLSVWVLVFEFSGVFYLVFGLILLSVFGFSSVLVLPFFCHGVALVSTLVLVSLL